MRPLQCYAISRLRLLSRLQGRAGLLHSLHRQVLDAAEVKTKIANFNRLQWTEMDEKLRYEKNDIGILSLVAGSE